MTYHKDDGPLRDARELPLAEIGINPRGRPVEPRKVKALADSMGEIGLRTPITVRWVRQIRDGREVEGWVVLAGSHRCEAARRLKWRTISCIVSEDDDLTAELWEIDENLCRAELSPVQMAEHTARRKALHEQLHPETKHGAAPGKAGGGKVAKEDKLASFATETASRTGRSERTVKRAAERGTKVLPEALAKIKGSRLDTGTYLDGLKKVPREAQVEQVERDLAAPPPARKAAAPKREQEPPRIPIDRAAAGPDLRQACRRAVREAEMTRASRAAGTSKTEPESVERRRWRREARQLFTRAPDPALVDDLVAWLRSHGYGRSSQAGADADVQALKREFAAERRKLKEKVKTANARRQDAEHFNSRLREELRQVYQRLEALQMRLDRAHGRMEADAEEPAAEHLDHSDDSPPAAGHDPRIDDDDMPDVPAFLRRSKAPAERA